jgi:hypothetical protein
MSGNAKIYDGVFDYDTATIATLSPNNTLEFGCLFYTTKSTGIQYLYDTRDSLNRNGFTLLINNGVIGIIQNNNSTSNRNVFVTNNQAITGAGYYFIQFTQTGTTTVAIWVNGVEFAVLQTESTPTVSNGTAFNLGRSPANIDRRFSGRIRKMQFLNTLQSDAVRAEAARVGSYEGLVPDAQFLLDVDFNQTSGNLTTRSGTPVVAFTASGGEAYTKFIP